MSANLEVSQQIHERLGISAEAIANFCQRWQIHELGCFGSVTRDDFCINSDIDLLVSFKQGASVSLFDLEDMEQEFSNLCGRSVDIVTKRAIEQSKNSIRQKNVLGTAQTIYEAR